MGVFFTRSQIPLENNDKKDNQLSFPGRNRLPSGLPSHGQFYPLNLLAVNSRNCIDALDAINFVIVLDLTIMAGSRLAQRTRKKLGSRDNLSELFLLDLFKSAEKPHAFRAEIESTAPGDWGFDKTISANNLLASVAIISLLHIIFTIRARHHNSDGKEKGKKIWPSSCDDGSECSGLSVKLVRHDGQLNLPKHRCRTLNRQSRWK